jgi:hypothetical protein
MRHRFARYELIRHKVARHKFMGAGAAVLAVAVALAVAGCGGSSDKDGQPPPSSGVTGRTTAPAPADSSSAADSAATTGGSTGKPTSTATATGTDSASPGATASPGADSSLGIEGVWLATEGSAKVQLVLGKGEAGLTSTSLCGGSYTDTDGVGLKLTCMDGNRDRTTGHGVLAPDGQTLTVKWTGGPTDAFSRTGLPGN